VLGLIDSAYEQEDVALEAGDMVVVFSDGVVEALNTANEEFGEERLMAVISPGIDNVEKLVAAVVDAVRQFSGNANQSDDITIMAIRYLGRPA
jgi:sigma-B regulation protein RsbU (phosphoserine phosphatase)